MLQTVIREIQVEGKSFSEFTEGQHFKTLQFPLREMMLSQCGILLTIQFQGFLLHEIQQGSYNNLFIRSDLCYLLLMGSFEII